MIKVTNEIIPCQRPMKKPAGSVSNFSHPGAQEVRKNITNAINTIGAYLIDFFMITASL